MTLGEVITNYPSAILTTCVALTFLWLALYVYRVNPDDTVSKLATGAMLTVFLYLLSRFMVSTATTTTQILVYQRMLWWLPFAPVLWLHLSLKATGTIRHGVLYSQATLGVFYGIALVFKIAELSGNGMFQLSSVNSLTLPLKNNLIAVGPIYNIFTVFSLITTLLACINFVIKWHESREAEFLWLSLGSVCFFAASSGLLIKTLTGIATGFAYGNSILAAGIIIVAVAILRHNALIKKEQLEQDIIYASLGAFGIAAIYIVVLIVGQGSISRIPMTTISLIAALALTSHMLADNIKIWFSRTIGTRIGLFSKTDVDRMQQLYGEASRVKRQPIPVVEIFDDDNATVQKLTAILTARQREIMVLRAKGLSDKQIASALDIKLPTVRKHIEDIKTRLGSRDKADCTVYCIVTGLLNKEDLMEWFDSLNLNDKHIK